LRLSLQRIFKPDLLPIIPKNLSQSFQIHKT
jgi:hypothetical protein